MANREAAMMRLSDNTSPIPLSSPFTPNHRIAPDNGVEMRETEIGGNGQNKSLCILGRIEGECHDRVSHNLLLIFRLYTQK